MTVWPVDGPVSQPYGSNPTAHLPANSWLIQTFGNYQPNGHTGVDFPVPVGTPVRAAATGVVKHVGWFTGAYSDNPYWISPSFAGFCLVIDHGSFVGIYAHLSGSNLIAGQRVVEGQVVAQSGNTGGSTGPHLHFEVLPDGWDFNNGMFGRVNPARYITGKPSIVPQSTTTASKEDTLSAAEVKQINDHAAKQADRVIDYIGAVLVGGYKVGDQQFPGVAKVDIVNQRDIRAIKALVQELVSNPNMTPEQVEAAVGEALAEGVVEVSFNGKPEAL